MSFEYEEVCEICYDLKKLEKLKCDTCKSTCCLNCFRKIKNGSKMSMETFKIDYRYKCPFCRIDNIYNYEDFDKNELIEMVSLDNKALYESHIIGDLNADEKLRNRCKDLLKVIEELSIKSKKNDDKMIEMERYIIELEYKNNEHKTNFNLLKNIIDNTKTKRIDKNSLKNLFIEF